MVIVVNPLNVLGVVGRAVTPKLESRHLFIPFLEEPWTSRDKFAAMIIQTFLYGVYMVLVASTLFMFYHRKIWKRPLVLSTLTLFALGTADMIVTAAYFLLVALKGSFDGPIIHSPEARSHLLEIKFCLYIISNAFTSGILINQSHNLWRNKCLLVLPMFLVIIGTVVSFISLTTAKLQDRLIATGFITFAAANIFVTTLIAARIWWVSRKAWELDRFSFTRLADFSCSLVLDTGAIYSVSIVLYLLFHTLVLNAPLTQIACVSVTCMMLRHLYAWEGGSNTSTFETTFSGSTTGQVLEPSLTYVPDRNLQRVDTISISSSSLK